MAQPQKFITLDNGRQKLTDIESVNASSGATDAAKLVRTAGDGKLDPSLMPTGVGADTLSLPSSENLSAGDFVNVWDDSGTPSVRKADASVAGKEADGYVVDAVTAGQSALVYFEGRNSALTALSVGVRYYLSAGTPGGTTATPPVATGNVVQYLGRASTTTSLVFEAEEGVILA